MTARIRTSGIRDRAGIHHRISLVGSAISAWLRESAGDRLISL
jgi:hypothetical protein